jgi:hypothetical protein
MKIYALALSNDNGIAIRIIDGNIKSGAASPAPLSVAALYGD